MILSRATCEIFLGLYRVLKLQPQRFTRTWTQYNERRGMGCRHELVSQVGDYPFGVAKPRRVCVGDGPASYRRELHTPSKRLGLKKHLV